VWKKRIEETTASSLDEVLPPTAKRSVLLFLLALVTIVVIAMFPSIRTIGDAAKPIKMSIIIQMMMLAFGGIILIVTKTKTNTIAEGVVFKSGMVAAIAIFGIAWMSDTYFKYAMPSFQGGITEMVQNYPWTFAFAMFAVSVVINSQAATCRMMLPVGLGLGLSPALLIGIMPSCYGYFFIPNYPSDIATCTFDNTGTTKIGKFYFNHSFMVPGLIGVPIACVVGYAIAHVLL
jgi:anaerobic C4-dicarboxylate transporter DcuB